jgi:hypothetical protein
MDSASREDPLLFLLSVVINDARVPTVYVVASAWCIKLNQFPLTSNYIAESRRRTNKPLVYFDNKTRIKNFSKKVRKCIYSKRSFNRLENALKSIIDTRAS